MLGDIVFLNFLTVSCVLLFNSFVLAKRSMGVLNTTQNWAYLDKFCFATTGGSLYYKSHQIESIYTYFDTDSQWKQAYNKSLSCEAKEKILNPQNHQLVRLTPDKSISDERGDCEEIQLRNETWFECEGRGSFLSVRPRWWYLALGNCDSKQGLFLEYTLMLTNGPTTDRWHYQFSFDQFYSWPETTFFLLLQSVLFLFALILACTLKKRKMYHKSYKLFLVSLVLDFCGTFFIWLHYDHYSRDGYGIPRLKILSMVYKQLAIITFVWLLLLIAKGYTITRARLSPLTRSKVIAFIVSYIVLRLLMLTWLLVIFDPAEVTYPSESIPAYILAVLNIVGWLWYIRSSYITVKKYPQKKAFYLHLSVPISFWFWAGPLILVFANFVLDDWVREEIVQGVDYAVMTFGYTVFLWLTRPSSANKNFPYHVRTNQICDGMDSNFPHNIYEVHYMTASPNGGNLEDANRADLIRQQQHLQQQNAEEK